MRIRAAVIGSGMSVPTEVLDNPFFVKNGPFRIYEGEDEDGPIWKKDEWDEVIWLPVTEEEIIRLTGIRERRKLSENQTVLDLALWASKEALEDSQTLPKELDAIVCACVTAPNDFPSLACLVQSRLGAANVRYALDVAAGCAGSVHSLDLGRLLITEGYKKVLVVGAEGLTPRTDYTDRNCILFGDGAGAVVLGRSFSEEGIIATDFMSNSCEGETSWLFADKKGFVRMPYGRKVMKLGIRNMVESAKNSKFKASEIMGISPADLESQIRYYFPHQANIRMLNGMAKEMRVNNIYENIEKYGNMSSATWLVALNEARREKKIKEGDLIVVTAFGSGLATGSAVIRL